MVKYFYDDYIYERWGIDVSLLSIYYVWAFTTFVIFAGGYCFASCMTYPYSNYWFRRNYQSTSNFRFAQEFVKCSQRVTRLVESMMERQNAEKAGAILLNIQESEAESAANNSKKVEDTES